MPCERPCGDCTTVSPCGPGCGCGGGTPPTPITPRCYDVQLPAGTYPYATIVVNAFGCIVEVLAGSPPVYAPDDCCPTTGGGSGERGPRGFPGDPGPAASVEVVPGISFWEGPGWRVENIGSSSAAIFQFFAPPPDEGGTAPSGTTGNVSGLDVVNGQVRGLPSNIVREVRAEKTGDRAGDFSFTAGHAPGAAHTYTLTLNLDGLLSGLPTTTQWADALQRLQDLESAVNLMPSSIYEIAVATGVNLIISGAVVPAVRVAGAGNIWFVGAAYDGVNIMGSTGTPGLVDALGNFTLPAGAFPTGQV